MLRGATLVGAVASLLGPPTAGAFDGGSRDSLERYARDTWASFVAITDPASGLPADSLSGDGTRSVQTSTTNIGAYLWSTLVAEELGIIDRGEQLARLTKTLDTLERMERHQPSGQYFNWYDHRSGEKLTVWPPTGEPRTPILSSVDNGWLATALRLVERRVPKLRSRAGRLFEEMDFGLYYRPDVNRILFHYVPGTGEEVCCYDTIVSESRIASYIGIAKGELPRREYFGTWRTFPDSCEFASQETRPVGATRRYFGVDVFEGSYRHRGARIVPSWGGSMFEALMPALFVPEERWAPGSWAINHPLTVEAQIDHGLDQARYGYWGFSPANVPEGGYANYGVDAIGMDPNGYPSNEDSTLVNAGFAGCRTASRSPIRPRPSTPTGSSPRTPPSSRCAGPRGAHWRTSAGSSATSTAPTVDGGFATASTSRPGRSRARISPSIKG